MSTKRKTKDEYLKESQQIAIKRGGKCLSKKYTGTHSKLEWECAEGHKWMAGPSKIKNDRWCPECGKQKGGLSRRLSIEDAQKLAKIHEGKCLSKEYVVAPNKLLWQCSKGHEWSATYSSIQNGRWCPECGKQKGGLSRRLSIDDAQKLAKIHEGKCLSEKYVVAPNKLLWQCFKGHEWWATYNSIHNGKWCPYCAGQIRSIEDAKKLAKKKNGQCLSKIYKNCHKNLKWQCSEEHQWEASYTSIQKGRWCPKCSSRQRHSIDDAQKIAKERGGKCLTKRYINTKIKLTWQCSKGHQWDAIYSSIQIGRWCPICAGTQPLSIEDMQKIAKERGGSCLSKVYKRSSSILKWKCAKGHVWEARSSHVKAGSWCPICAGKQPLSIGDMQKIAKERGGKCLSKEYKRAYEKLEWECKNGHKWERSYVNIQSGSWCPECSPFISLGEKFCRLSCESLFKCKFPKSTPDWLKSKEGYQLELDGFSEEYNIAFEHQGIQHYKYNNRFHKSEQDFEKQKRRDNEKRRLCKKNGVILIEVPQIPVEISLEELVPFIIKELEKNKIKTTHLNHEVPNFNNIYLKDEYSEIYDEIKKIVKKKNGKILSEKYLGSKTKLEFECKDGHRWKALKESIIRDRWCPICGHKNKNKDRKLTIEHMRQIARERGGDCLSDEYVNVGTKLKWVCSKGHLWEAKPSHIRAGRWCPICARKKY